MGWPAAKVGCGATLPCPWVGPFWALGSLMGPSGADGGWYCVVWADARLESATPGWQALSPVYAGGLTNKQQKLRALARSHALYQQTHDQPQSGH